MRYLGFLPDCLCSHLKQKKKFKATLLSYNGQPTETTSVFQNDFFEGYTHTLSNITAHALFLKEVSRLFLPTRIILEQPILLEFRRKFAPFVFINYHVAQLKPYKS